MSPAQDFEPTSDPSPYAPSSRPGYYRDPRLKSPVMAALLSLMPGLGQTYLGYTQLGFIHAAAVASMIALLSTNRLQGLEPLVGIFMAFFWMYNVVDAHRRAILVNEAIARIEPSQMPEGLQVFTAQGRLLLGLILVVVGTLALLEQRFGVSMEWVYQWWPAGLVLLGVYLLVKAIRDRQAQAPNASE
jgi:hypothetical protein